MRFPSSLLQALVGVPPHDLSPGLGPTIAPSQRDAMAAQLSEQERKKRAAAVAEGQRRQDAFAAEQARRAREDAELLRLAEMGQAALPPVLNPGPGVPSAPSGALPPERPPERSPGRSLPRVALPGAPQMDLSRFGVQPATPLVEMPIQSGLARANTMQGSPELIAALIPGAYADDQRAISGAATNFGNAMARGVDAGLRERQLQESQRQFGIHSALANRGQHLDRFRTQVQKGAIRQREVEVQQRAAEARQRAIEEHQRRSSARAVAEAKASAAQVKAKTEALKQANLSADRRAKIAADLWKHANRSQPDGRAPVGTLPHFYRVQRARDRLEALNKQAQEYGWMAQGTGVRGFMAWMGRHATSIPQAVAGSTMDKDRYDAFRLEYIQALQEGFAAVRPPGQQSDKELQFLLSAFGFGDTSLTLPSGYSVRRQLELIQNELDSQYEQDRKILASYGDPRITAQLGIGDRAPRSIDDLRQRYEGNVVPQGRTVTGVTDETGDEVSTTARPTPPLPTSDEGSFLPAYGVTRITSTESGHSLRGSHGIDFAYAEGTSVMSPIAGGVQKVGQDARSGHYVVVQDRFGNRHVFAHLARAPAVSEGDVVRMGQHLGQSGASGRATGPHLHYQTKGRDRMSIQPRMARRLQLAPHINELAIQIGSELRVGLSPGLMMRLIDVETGGKFDPSLVGAKGERGLTQLTPGAVRDIESTAGFVAPEDWQLSPGAQITLGTYYMGMLLRMFDDDVDKAVAAYNWGLGNVRRNPDPSSWPKSVQRYVARVTGRANE